MDELCAHVVNSASTRIVRHELSYTLESWEIGIIRGVSSTDVIHPKVFRAKKPVSKSSCRDWGMVFSSPCYEDDVDVVRSEKQGSVIR